MCIMYTHMTICGCMHIQYNFDMCLIFLSQVFIKFLCVFLQMTNVCCNHITALSDLFFKYSVCSIIVILKTTFVFSTCQTGCDLQKQCGQQNPRIMHSYAFHIILTTLRLIFLATNDLAVSVLMTLPFLVIFLQ